MNMRRKPNTQGGSFNNNQRRHHGGHQRSNNNGGGGQYNRPRKNYGQLREKYLAQARDAMAAGDRVLAENYFQHADHCYRMMMEDLANRPQPRPQTPREQQEGAAETGAEEAAAAPETEEEDLTPPHASALPSFITGHGVAAASAQPAPAQNWEERDAE